MKGIENRMSILFAKLFLVNIKHLVLLCISILFISWMPLSDTGCVAEVQSIYKSMKMDDLDKGNVYMNYSIITHYAVRENKPVKPAKTNVEFVIGKTQMYYKTAEAVVFIDTTDNFTIIPERKVVYWSNSMLEVEKEKRIKSFSILQDSLFQMSELVECKTQVNTAEGFNKVVIMQPMEKAKKVYPYKRFSFYINTEQKKLKKVVVEFPAGFEFTKMELIYNKIETQYTGEELNKTAKSKIVTGGNALNDQYTGYTLIDNRAVPNKKIE